MATEMRADADLLNVLLNETPLVVDRITGRSVAVNAKMVAHWTDRSIQTVSDYRIGKLNIPVCFWRRILEHYLDSRIAGLIIPDTCEYDVQALDGTDPVTGPQWFREAITAEGEHHEQQKHLADILADGRVDELDSSSVQAYDDAYRRHRMRDAMLHQGIIRRYKRAVAVREAEA